MFSCFWGTSPRGLFICKHISGFVRNAIFFSKGLYHFTFPAAAYEWSSFSSCSAALAVGTIFYFSDFDRCNATLLWFGFACPRWPMKWNIFWVMICHPYTLFVKCLFMSFAHFLEVLSFLTVKCFCCFYKHFIEVWLTYRTLCLFNVYNLMLWEINIHL